MAKNKKDLLKNEEAGKNFENLPKEEMEEVQGAGDTEGETINPTIFSPQPASIPIVTTILRK